ncbi:MAG TPA: hypothetical protein VIJ62_15050 [Rhizomicrobium sp.]
MNAPETTFSNAEIAAELRRIARLDARSLAARIAPSMFDGVLAVVVRNIAPGFDIEVAVLAALGRARDCLPDAFTRRKRRKRPMASPWHLPD